MIKDLRDFIRDVPDFPKPGIIFKDIAPLLANHEAFQYSVQQLSDRAWHHNAEAIVAIESRGFIFGGAIAVALGVPFIPVRKKGKLPGETHAVDYALEYGKATLEINTDLLPKGSRAVIVDDVLATGGTADAASQLIHKAGAKAVALLCLLELQFLSGRSKLKDLAVDCLIQF